METGIQVGQPSEQLVSHAPCQASGRGAGKSEDLERKAVAILPPPRKRNVLLHSILVDANEAAVEKLQLEIIKGPYVLWCGDFGRIL